MEKFTKLEGVAAPLKMVNVDTDMIIPADYLKTLKRTGLAKGLFSRIRRRADGSEDFAAELKRRGFEAAAAERGKCRIGGVDEGLAGADGTRDGEQGDFDSLIGAGDGSFAEANFAAQERLDDFAKIV